MYNLLHLFRFPLTRYKSWTLHSYLSFYEMSIVCVKRAVFWTPIGIEFVFENSTDMLLRMSMIGLTCAGVHLSIGAEIQVGRI